MPRKGENIYRRADGRREARYIKGRTPEGKACYGYVYARSYGEVKKKLNDVIRSMNALSEKNVCMNKALSKSFSEVAEAWLKSNQPKIKSSSYAKYYNMVYSYILPYYSGFSIQNIKFEDIENFYGTLLKEGGKNHTGLSEKTVNDVLTVLRLILKYAKMKDYSPGSDGKGISAKTKSQNICILSPEDQRKLMEYLINHATPRNVGILLCIFTGIRIGELCALKWDDISLTEKTLYVHGTMQRIQLPDSEDRKTKVITTTPKSPCSVRYIPLPTQMVRILENYTEKRTGYILTGDDNKFVEPRLLEKHFKKVLKECNLKPVKFHALRHSFATRCVELNFDVKTLSEILGHANTSITMNRYVHPSMELKRENMEKLSNLFSVE